MAKVFIPAQLRELTAGAAEIDIEAPTVQQLIAALNEQYPGIAARLCPQGIMAPGWSVSVDGAMSPRGLLARVNPTSEVYFLPALGGG